jgi:hypothetical protein
VSAAQRLPDMNNRYSSTVQISRRYAANRRAWPLGAGLGVDVAVGVGSAKEWAVVKTGQP